MAKKTLSIPDKLYNLDLDTWANVLEVVGFIIAIFTLIISLIVTSKVNKIKRNYNFEKTIGKKIGSLKQITSKFNNLLDDYDNNFNEIKFELAILISEVKFIRSKVEFKYRVKLFFFGFLLKRKAKIQFLKKNERHFIQKLPSFIHKFRITTYDDIFSIYTKSHAIINELENLKLNYNNQI